MDGKFVSCNYANDWSEADTNTCGKTLIKCYRYVTLTIMASSLISTECFFMTSIRFYSSSDSRIFVQSHLTRFNKI